jgi:hypothetical protein
MLLVSASLDDDVSPSLADGEPAQPTSMASAAIEREPRNIFLCMMSISLWRGPPRGAA